MIRRAASVGLAIAFMTSAGAYAQSLKDAQIAIDAEQYAKAKTILKNLVENKPKDGQNYFYLGDIYLQTDYPDSAKTIFEQGLEADPKTNLNKVGLGAVELFQNNTSGAEQLFTEATAKLKKKDYLENLYIGRAYINPHLEEPDYKKALTYLEKAKEANQKDALIPSSLGDAYFGLKDANNAYSSYRDAYDMDNSFTRARVQMTIISKQARAFPEAIEDLQAIAAEHADYAPAFRELAETYNAYAQFATKSEDYDSRIQEALKYYKQYMDLTDYSLDSRMRYADFLIKAKDYQALEEQANEMAKVDKVNPRILRYLGYAAYENGNYAESQQALTDFFSKVEENRVIPQDYYFLGLSEVRQATDTTAEGDTSLLSQSIANLTKAVELDTTWGLAEDLSNIAKENFNEKKFDISAALFKAAAQAPESKTYNYDLFYWGFSQYFNYATHINDEPAPSKDVLNDADAAFAKVNEVAPEMPEAYLYKAKTKSLLEDPEDPQGLAVPDYKKYLEVIQSKDDETVQKSGRFIAEAYNVIAADLVNKEQYEEARENLRKALEAEPGNAYATQTLEQLEPDASAQQ
ncbi:tetratricopeptide repeat protein [Olivibacter sp. SDN3]|uniref:tetratricopeptide repeat protein n=1 Tax=Olivibacter sp. SDN3 TaxID=2764720 RepID=UPI001651727A|nr:tetratricopeptide repeat protein [Olivibacter sp. SDN3]QNL51378.1 tetratricopeptide repeat protein [Olivibacter sp. SDN3]